jgi:hypothetical protein
MLNDEVTSTFDIQNSLFDIITVFNGLIIRYPCPAAFYIVAYIQHNACEKVNNKRETNRQEGRINKKQPYFRNRDIKTLAQVSANPERVPFKKCDQPL